MIALRRRLRVLVSRVARVVGQQDSFDPLASSNGRYPAWAPPGHLPYSPSERALSPSSGPWDHPGWNTPGTTDAALRGEDELPTRWIERSSSSPRRTTRTRMPTTSIASPGRVLDRTPTFLSMRERLRRLPRTRDVSRGPVRPHLRREHLANMRTPCGGWLKRATPARGRPECSRTPLRPDATPESPTLMLRGSRVLFRPGARSDRPPLRSRWFGGS